MLLLFNWALNCAFVADRGEPGRGGRGAAPLARSAFFLVIAVAIVGIIFQTGIAGQWPRRTPPRRA